MSTPDTDKTIDKTSIKLVREAHRKQLSRISNLAYAFVRGVPHAIPEPRVREHNMPSVMGICAFILTCTDPEAAKMASMKLYEHVRAQPLFSEVTAWCKMPEYRIVRQKPRVKKMRQSNRQPTAESA